MATKILTEPSVEYYIGQGIITQLCKIEHPPGKVTKLELKMTLTSTGSGTIYIRKYTKAGNTTTSRGTPINFTSGTFQYTDTTTDNTDDKEITDFFYEMGSRADKFFIYLYAEDSVYITSITNFELKLTYTPITFDTTVTTSAIGLVWNAIDGVDAYQIRYKESSSSSWTVSEKRYVNNYSINNLSPGTTYDVQLRVAKIATDGLDGSWSDTTQITTFSNYTATAPTGVTATAYGSDCIYVSWNAGNVSSNQTLNGYIVGYSNLTLNESSTSPVHTYSTVSDLYRSCYNLNSSSQYKFWVKTDGSQTDSDWSLPAQATTGSTTPTITPPTITNVSSSNLNATISVNTGSCSGTIYYSIISASAYSNATTHYGNSGSKTSNPFTVAVPSAGSYYFQVNMYYNGTQYYSNAVGPYSFSSGTIEGSCSITSFTINDGSTATVIVSGTNTTGVWYYKVSTNYSEVSGDIICSDSSGTTSNTFTIYSTFASNTRYYLRVSRQVITGASPKLPEGGTSTTWTLSDEIAYATAPTIIISHPQVQVGAVIEQASMDSLRYYKGNASTITEVSEGTKITAADGNTYKSGLIKDETKITADWYNNA